MYPWLLVTNIPIQTMELIGTHMFDQPHLLQQLRCYNSQVFIPSYNGMTIVNASRTPMGSSIKYDEPVDVIGRTIKWGDGLALMYKDSIQYCPVDFNDRSYKADYGVKFEEVSNWNGKISSVALCECDGFLFTSKWHHTNVISVDKDANYTTYCIISHEYSHSKLFVSLYWRCHRGISSQWGN